MANDVVMIVTDLVNEALARKVRRDRSRPHKYYLEAVLEQTQYVKEVTARRDFVEGLETIKATQALTLVNFSGTDAEYRNIQEIMEVLEIGEVHYRVLRDEPSFYRDKIAAGFQRKDRIAPDRLLPKDGMHRALLSYASHMGSRHSPMLADEEKDMLTAYAVLATAMQDVYQLMQREVLIENNAGDS